MQTEITITILPSDENNIDLIKKKASRELFKNHGKIDPKKINITVIKKSIDARRKPVKLVLRCRVYTGEDFSASVSSSSGQKEISASTQVRLPEWKHADGLKKVVIIGAGPAGLFAALRLLEDGIKPVIIERGSQASERKKDIALISTQGTVDLDSNYCFGQGGAGMFSDGKLYTRSKKRGNIDSVLQIFAHFGASPSILSDAHPHIGTDKLPQIVEAMCQKITEMGGEIHYNTRCIDFLCEPYNDRKQLSSIIAVNTQSGEFQQISGEIFILATGHSATDIYKLMAKADPLTLEAKTFACGVRIEHPKELIDTIQFHGQNLQEKLPSAEYRLTTQADDRGVYSFCMCPGGFVVPSSTAPKEIVINGMSAAKRNSRWSNAAIVTEIRPEDIPEKFIKQAADENCQALAGLFFRASLEQETFSQAQAAGAKENSQQAPSQRLTDFLAHKKSASLPETSYTPGIVSSRIDEWLFPHISRRLEKAFCDFDKKMHGFITEDAIIIASETRTSTPVRILRNKETLECDKIVRLYPAGEGSGYSGGIVSSAIDGINVAEKIAARLK